MQYSFIYFSPHLDDVILSCGGILKKNQNKSQLIVNIFSGEYKGLTKWDLSCKFKKKIPIQTRKKENKKALKLIKVTSMYFNFFDNLFFNDLKNSERPFSEIRKIKCEISKILKKNTSSLKTIFFPLGISHPDHFLVAKIGKDKAKELKRKGVKVYFYEDFPFLYNSKYNSSLFLKDFIPVYFRIDKEISAKIRMIISYESQLFPLLKILYPQLQIETLEKRKRMELVKKLWRKFLLKYSQKLGRESKIKKVKYCERFWILK